MSGESNINKRNVHIAYLDGLRCVCCIFVVILHSAAFVLQKLELTPFNFFIGHLFDSISRFAVPVFVMISGTLMLDENKMYTKENLKKRIKKMFIFFVGWSVVYQMAFSVILPLLEHEDIDLWDIVIGVLKGYSHLWFIPMIIGCYLITPLLRLWVKIENMKYVKYFLMLSFVFGFVSPQVISIVALYFPKFLMFYDVLEGFYLFYPLGYLFYFVAGWYLANRKLISNRILIAVGVTGFLVTFVGTYLINLNNLYDGEVNKILYDNLSLNVMMCALSIYGLFQNNYKKCGKVQSKICELSLGIYALHPAIISFVGVLLLMRGVENAVVVFVICLFVSLSVAVLTCMIGKKIKFLNVFFG